MFEPKDLICTIESVMNPIESQEGDEDNENVILTYPIICNLTIHTPGGGNLPAVMQNQGNAIPKTGDNNKLSITFKSGELVPAASVLSDPEKMTLWRTTFEKAYSLADAERSYIARLGRFAISLLLGLKTPSDNSLSYEMKRPPCGYLDVLFLDEELRITKGNRGSIIVVERVHESEPSPN